MAETHYVTRDELRAELAEAHYVTRDELRAELAEMKVDLIEWMVGTGLAIAAVTATLAGIVLRALQ
ncbi:MAG: hypothetical protein OXH75_29055 [Acidobacteria bacterium]|nr:hypothetical protein [Acidobacteriota bacterium]